MDDTDLTKFIFLLDKFKIKYTVDNNKDYEGTEFEETLVKIDEGVGYYNFYATFTFDVDGKFVEHGVWE